MLCPRAIRDEYLRRCACRHVWLSGKALLHLLLAQRWLVVTHHESAKLAHRVFRTGLVELLELLDLLGAEPVRCGFNVGTI